MAIGSRGINHYPMHNAINLQPVYDLYAGCLIIGVEEFYIPGLAWTSLVDGRHINTCDRTPEEQVELAIKEGATTIQFKIRTKEGRIAYPDYTVTQLTA